MAAGSKIEWTEATWNPVTGCDKVSAGCKNCYAERMAMRLQKMGSDNYRDGFKVRCHPHMLDRPRAWKKPRTVFVNSMSDLFHEEVPIGFVQRVLETVHSCPQHRFQALTKRPDRVIAIQDQLDWPDNLWMGVSVEDERVAHRIDALRMFNSPVRFLSLEPLLGPLPDLNLDGVHWVIVGGESGPGARPCREEWVTDLRDQCRRARVAFFFKQWGGVRKHTTGRKIDGIEYSEFPRAV